MPFTVETIISCPIKPRAIFSLLPPLYNPLLLFELVVLNTTSSDSSSFEIDNCLLKSICAFPSSKIPVSSSFFLIEFA